MVAGNLPFFLHALDRRGLSLDEIARAAGLKDGSLRGLGSVDYELGMRLWEGAERVSGDPCVGLHIGASVRVDELGPLGSAVVHARDLRAALETLGRLIPFVITGAQLCFDGDTLVYESPRTDGPGSRHGVDGLLACIMSLSRQCTGHPLDALAVTFPLPAPPSVQPYVRCFGARPEWGAARCSLSLAAADLARPLQGASPELAELVTENAPRLLGGERRAPIVRDVERALALALREGREPTVTWLAGELGASPRSLQRWLRDAGSSVRALRDRVRREAAERWLREGERNHDSIAERLGFANRSAFERAFRRWTGETPAAFRRRNERG